jgi:hypothetical protein
MLPAAATANRPVVDGLYVAVTSPVASATWGGPVKSFPVGGVIVKRTDSPAWKRDAFSVNTSPRGPEAGEIVSSPAGTGVAAWAGEGLATTDPACLVPPHAAAARHKHADRVSALPAIAV